MDPYRISGDGPQASPDPFPPKPNQQVALSVRGQIRVDVQGTLGGYVGSIRVSAPTDDGRILVEKAGMSNGGNAPTSRAEWEAFKTFVDRAWAEFDRAVAERSGR